MFLKLLAGICMTLAASSTLAASTVQPAPLEKFITISDIHFDPFSDCKALAITPCQLVAKLQAAPATEWKSIFEKYGTRNPQQFGSDTNYVFLKSTLAAVTARAQAENPRFAIFLGDFLAHNFHSLYTLYSHDATESGYESFVEKTFQFLAGEMHQALPGIDIYPVVGNNDAYEDYKIIVNGKLLQQQAKIWSSLISEGDNRKNFTETFPQAGFYAVNVPGTTSQRIIVLDTVLFSRHANNKKVKAEANQQLAWLSTQLAAAQSAHQSVILAYHIPFGVDVFATIHYLFSSIVTFWQTDETDRFDAILKEFPGTVKVILAGHLHRDDFQVFRTDKNNEIAISVTPSISPIYGNNPGYKIYSFDPASFDIKNYDVYYYPLSTAAAIQPAWQKEYDFNQAYPTYCHNCSITSGMNTVTPRGEAANFFKQFFPASAQEQVKVIDHDWLPYYWCHIHSVTEADYTVCINWTPEHKS
jgi:sphingomyelin phosphodiesterase acid-like 3